MEQTELSRRKDEQGRDVLVITKKEKVDRAKFDAQKKMYLDLVEDEEQRKELDEKLKTQADLDEFSWIYDHVVSEPFERFRNEYPALKSTPENPPQGSTVRLPSQPSKKWVYDTPEHAIDDLYSKMAAGGPDAKEAEKILSELWKRFIPKIRDMKGEFFLQTMCPACGFKLEQVDISNGFCPSCGANLADQVRRGLEVL